MKAFETVLRLIILYFVLPISVILGVMHNRWEWWQLRRAAISFSIAAVLTIVTCIIALLVGYWLHHVIKGGRRNEQ